MKDMWKLIQRAADWFFRRRSPALFFARLGFMLAAFCASGFAVNLAISSQQGEATLSLSPSDGIPTEFMSIGFCIGLLIMVGCVLWELQRDHDERRRLAKQRVIALEVRGLRDFPGSPLTDAIPASFEGRRESMLVDLRQIQDGVVMQPEAAIGELSHIPRELARRCSEGGRADVRVVYAGLASVPFTFLTGVLVDDEGAVTCMDWDRNQRCWRMLDGIDDEERFDESDLEAIEQGSAEVVVAVSVSYGVDIAGTRHILPGIPLVELRLPRGGPDAHWSLEKQRGMGKQFLRTMISLGNKGVRKIHLFLAAQNSVVFLLGQLYDKRNLPEVVVYQYERGQSPPFPWGISMPVAGQPQAAVVRSN